MSAGDHRSREALLAALDASERRFQDLVESSYDLIWSVDAEGRWTFLNRQATLRIYGREPRELLGRPFIEVIAPERVERDLAQFEEIKEGQDVFDYETVHLHASGARVPLKFNAITRRSADGALIGTTGTAREWTGELRQRQRNRAEALGALAGGVAHDFRNLLVGIVGFTELLRVGLEESGGDERHLELVSRILDAAGTAGELTSQLVSMSRRAPSERRVVDLAEVVSGAASFIGHLIDRRISIRVSLPDGPRYVVGDRAQLQNALLNLGLNARDAMPDGGELRFELDDAPPGESQEPGRVRLVVRDSGSGIHPKDREKVFLPYFTTKGMEHGTGLGLTVARATVQDHGGAIWVESAPGEGSAFTIELPTTTRRPESERPDAPPPQADGEHVLLVDDEEVARIVASTMLENLGYEVTEAPDGVEALALLEQRMPDLIILDLMMPRMGGLEFLRRLREKEIEVPVLVVSGLYDDGKKGGGVPEGAAGALPKPYRLKSLADAVRRALDAPARPRGPRR